MDRVLRTYAHTAWTPADPLAGLDADVRRAVLLMPSTFRERWKLAPWTSRHQRQFAIIDIVAERRLLYELTHQKLTTAAPQPPTPSTPPAAPSDEATSPYYRYRMALHRQAVDTMQRNRAEQDRRDIERLPEARADRERRQEARRNALLALDIERARLDLKELVILDGRAPSDIAAAPLAARKSPAKRKKRDRDR